MVQLGPYKGVRKGVSRPLDGPPINGWGLVIGAFGSAKGSHRESKFMYGLSKSMNSYANFIIKSVSDATATTTPKIS